jgi:hypothetical protein
MCSSGVAQWPLHLPEEKKIPLGHFYANLFYFTRF